MPQTRTAPLTANSPVIDDPAHPRVHIDIELRWGDLDAYNHVNNTAMLKLLEEARIRAFWQPAPGEQGPPTAILGSSVETGILTLIARQEIEYLAPVPYQRHPLDVRLWFGRIGGASADVCYEVYRSPLAGVPVCYARSTAVIVLADAVTGKAQRLPNEVVEAWSPYLDEPISYAHRR